MSTILLTWNPGPDNNHMCDPEQWDEEMVRPYLDSQVVPGDWSVGRHVNNIGRGDVGFMYRQGEHGRGIVARATIETRPWTSARWDNPRQRCNYVDVTWTAAVPIDFAIDVERLEEIAPGFEWDKVYQSGRALPDDVAAALEQEWAEHVASEQVHAYSKLYVSDVWREAMNSTLATL